MLRKKNLATQSGMTGSDPTKEASTNAIREFRIYGPRLLTTVGTAVLIWLVGNYLFIPISQGFFIGIYAVTQLVSFIILAALAILVYGIFTEIGHISDATAELLASRAVNSGVATSEEIRDYRVGFRGILYVLVVAGAYILFVSQLNLISPVLS